MHCTLNYFYFPILNEAQYSDSKGFIRLEFGLDERLKTALHGAIVGWRQSMKEASREAHEVEMNVFYLLTCHMLRKVQPVVLKSRVHWICHRRKPR